MDGYLKLNSNSIIRSIKIDPPISLCDQLIIRAEESQDDIKLIFGDKALVKESNEIEYSKKTVVLMISHFKENVTAYKITKKTHFHRFRFVGSYDDNSVMNILQTGKLMICDEFFNHGELLLICGILKSGFLSKDYIAFRISIDAIRYCFET